VRTVPPRVTMGHVDTMLMEKLAAAHDEVLAAASEALERAHLVHYEAAGAPESRDRLEGLLRLVEEGVAEQTLVPVSRYAERVAAERYRAGFDVGEVQTAFNVLEEAIWHCVVRTLPPEDLVHGAGLIGTLMGAGKDALARTWVSLASRQHVASLDLRALFEGAGG
jgi:hypothetical protein